MAQELCPKCRGTQVASVEKNRVRGVVRCDCVKVSRSDRLMDEAPRLYEMCKNVEMTGRDFRQENKVQEFRI